MKVTAVDSFTIRLEPPGRSISGLGITRVSTDEGVTGYGFRITNEEVLARQVRPRLIGANPLDIEGHLAAGTLKGCASVENALWDVAGKTYGLPVRRLFGSARDRIPYYLTCVWPGKADQSHMRPEQQAADIVRYYELGHTRIKFRGWRPDPWGDVRVVEAVREAVGGKDKIELMIDRTAQPGWSVAFAAELSRELEKLNVTWLEEPFPRADIESYRQLAEQVDIPITGVEFGTEFEHFRNYLVASAVDIIQPDVYLSGGIWPCRKVAALAEAFNIPCILHGTNGPDLAASLQVAASISSCRMMEFAIMTAPLTPEQMWEPVDQILQQPGLFRLEGGDVVLNDNPGLGLPLREDIIESLRADDVDLNHYRSYECKVE
jgi:L-alanine-DL-glutamate epimerase-like enolase superfamily enzyme